MSKPTIKELCRQAGISPICYYKRLSRGMSKEEALTTPLMRFKSKPIKIYGGYLLEKDFKVAMNNKRKPYDDSKTYIGKVFKDDSHKPVVILNNADFNNVLGGYRISILNHIKEGEYRFQIIKLGEQKPFYTNNFQQFSQEINKILTLIRG